MHARFIDDPCDPQIAPYRFVKERDLKREDGLFVAEGEVVVRHLLGQKIFRAHSLLVTPTHAEKFEALLNDLPAPPPLYVAQRDILDEIAGFPLHRGILGLGCRRAAMPLHDALTPLPSRALVLCAVGIANHDNMGSLYRNAAAFGVDLLVLDKSCCDPLYRKAIRVSVGAALTVPTAFAEDAGEMMDGLEAHGFSCLALSPGAENLLADIPSTSRLALMLGSEGTGLPREALLRAMTARIAMAAGWDSLNVAATAAIALYEIRRRT